MVTAVLVDRKIVVGEELLKKLDEDKFSISGAFWFYRDESESWKLKIASPLVDSEGQQAAISRIQTVLRASPELRKRLPLSDIWPTSPNDKLVKALKAMFGTGSDVAGKEQSPFYGDGAYSGGIYIYRL